MKSHGFWRTLLASTSLAAVIWLFLFALLVPLGNLRAADEYDFNWLDPDKKISVLQNRKFRKAKRPHATLMGGLGFGETYRNTVSLDARVGYFFTENWGVEVFFEKFFNRENNAVQALTNASSTAIPVIRQIQSGVGGLVSWSPWYAKINVFNTILHFDWYFSGGLGIIQTELDTNTIVGQASVLRDENFTAFFLGTGHQFHLSQRFLVRLDFMATFYRAPSFGTSGADTWFSNTNFHAGIGVRL